MSVRVTWRKESDSYLKEHACEREMGVKGVNKKGIQIFEFEMMIHVIHTRTKIEIKHAYSYEFTHIYVI